MDENNINESPIIAEEEISIGKEAQNMVEEINASLKLPEDGIEEIVLD